MSLCGWFQSKLQQATCQAVILHENMVGALQVSQMQAGQQKDLQAFIVAVVIVALLPAFGVCLCYCLRCRHGHLHHHGSEVRGSLPLAHIKA